MKNEIEFIKARIISELWELEKFYLRGDMEDYDESEINIGLINDRFENVTAVILFFKDELKPYEEEILKQINKIVYRDQL
jgi:hypothetical protein